MITGERMSLAHPRLCHIHSRDRRSLSVSHLSHKTAFLVDFSRFGKRFLQQRLIKLIIIDKLEILILCHRISSFLICAGLI